MLDTPGMMKDWRAYRGWEHRDRAFAEAAKSGKSLPYSSKCCAGWLQPVSLPVLPGAGPQRRSYHYGGGTTAGGGSYHYAGGSTGGGGGYAYGAAGGGYHYGGYTNGYGSSSYVGYHSGSLNYQP